MVGSFLPPKFIVLFFLLSPPNSIQKAILRETIFVQSFGSPTDGLFDAQTMSINIISENDHHYFASGPVLKENLYSQGIKAFCHLEALLKATKAVSSDSS